jgi:hypothetical protein
MIVACIDYSMERNLEAGNSHLPKLTLILLMIFPCLRHGGGPG